MTLSWRFSPKNPPLRAAASPTTKKRSLPSSTSRPGSRPRRTALGPGWRPARRPAPPARSSSSVKGRPAANSAPVTSKWLDERPSTSDAVRLVAPGRAADQHAAADDRRHDDLYATSRTCAPPREQLGEGGLERAPPRLLLRGRRVGVARAVVGEDVVGAELPEQQRHLVAQAGQQRGHEDHGHDADDHAGHGQPRRAGCDAARRRPAPARLAPSRDATRASLEPQGGDDVHRAARRAG